MEGVLLAACDRTSITPGLSLHFLLPFFSLSRELQASERDASAVRLYASEQVQMVSGYGLYYRYY
jgi:hypothetical protein